MEVHYNYVNVHCHFGLLKQLFVGHNKMCYPLLIIHFVGFCLTGGVYPCSYPFCAALMDREFLPRHDLYHQPKLYDKCQSSLMVMVLTEH